MINLSPSTTSRIRAGAEAFFAGTDNLVFAAEGDSTDRGVDETAVPYNSQYELSVTEQLAILFRGDGIASGALNWFGISGTSLTDYKNRDRRLVTSGTAAIGSSVIQGGSGLSMSSSTAAAAVTMQGEWNEARIFTLQNSAFNGATLNANIDGGANTAITQDATNTIRSTTLLAGAVGTHTVNLAWASGANALFGIECFDNTRKEVSFRNWAQSGGTASQMIDNTGSPSAGRLNQYSLYRPHGSFGSLGLANSWRNGTAVADVKSQVEQFIDAVHSYNSDFIFTTPPFDSGVAGNTANQQLYVDAAIESCLAKGCAVLDMRKALVSKAASDAAGYTVASDAVHYTIAGQAFRAALLRPLLRYAMGL